MITGWLLYTCNEYSNSNGSQDVFLTIFNCTCSLSIICSVIKVKYWIVKLFLLLQPRPLAHPISALASQPHTLLQNTVLQLKYHCSFKGEVVNCFCCQTWTWSQQNLVKLIVYHQSLQKFCLPSCVCNGDHLSTPNMTRVLVTSITGTGNSGRCDVLAEDIQEVVSSFS